MLTQASCLPSSHFNLKRGESFLSQSSIQEQASTLCQQCGLCCVGVACGSVAIAPEADEAFVGQFSEHIVIASDQTLGWVSQPCPAFEGFCTVYETRPQDCRTYRCNTLENFYQGSATFEEAVIAINGTVSALHRLAERYTDANGKKVSWQAIYTLMEKLYQAAQGRNEEEQFWRQYPEYLMLSFLKDKHFFPGLNVPESPASELPF